VSKLPKTPPPALANLPREEIKPAEISERVSEAPSAIPPSPPPAAPILWSSLIDAPSSTSKAKVPSGWTTTGPDWANDVIVPRTGPARLCFSDPARRQFAGAGLRDQQSAAAPILVSEFRQHSTLSPDGRFLLGEHQRAGDTLRALGAVSLVSGQFANRFEGVNSVPRFVEFIDEANFVVADRRGREPGTAQVWNVASGKKEREFSLSEVGESAAKFAISPGGRYVTIGMEDGSLRFIDLTDGDLAGELRFEAPRGRSTVPRWLEFSPDGRELVAWHKIGEVGPEPAPNSCLVCWDLQTGRQLKRHDFSVSLKLGINDIGNDLPDLVWLGDHGWLAFGRWLIDRESGQVIWRMPRPENFERLLHVWPIDEKQLLIGWTAIDQSARRRSVHLASFPLPVEEIKTAQRQAREGQPPTIPDLPTKKLVDIL
jgi:WD40 repeat protein